MRGERRDHTGRRTLVRPREEHGGDDRFIEQRLDEGRRTGRAAAKVENDVKSVADRELAAVGAPSCERRVRRSRDLPALWGGGGATRSRARGAGSRSEQASSASTETRAASLLHVAQRAQWSLLRIGTSRARLTGGAGELAVDDGLAQCMRRARSTSRRAPRLVVGSTRRGRAEPVRVVAARRPHMLSMRAVVDVRRSRSARPSLAVERRRERDERALACVGSPSVSRAISGRAPPARRSRRPSSRRPWGRRRRTSRPRRRARSTRRDPSARRR